jgi:predicted transcriptional regulator
LTERPDVASAKILRKRWVRNELVQRGESKQDYIASVLGVSRQFVARCLSEHHRDEFSESHLERLGLLDRRAA